MKIISDSNCINYENFCLVLVPSKYDGIYTQILIGKDISTPYFNGKG